MLLIKVDGYFMGHVQCSCPKPMAFYGGVAAYMPPVEAGKGEPTAKLHSSRLQTSISPDPYPLVSLKVDGPG